MRLFKLSSFSNFQSFLNVSLKPFQNGTVIRYQKRKGQKLIWKTWNNFYLMQISVEYIW